MKITEADSISDVDEALAHLSAELRKAELDDVPCRCEVIAEYIDRLLEKRTSLGQATAPHA